MKPSHIKSELSNLIKNDWLASVDAGVEPTVSVNTVYEQLAKIDRVLEILEDNKPNGVVDENSIESLNLKRNTSTALKEAQLNTIEDLKKYGVTGLRTLKNLGNKSVSQIVEALQSRGIELPELLDPEPEHTPSL